MHVPPKSGAVQSVNAGTGVFVGMSVGVSGGGRVAMGRGVSVSAAEADELLLDELPFDSDTELLSELAGCWAMLLLVARGVGSSPPRWITATTMKMIAMTATPNQPRILRSDPPELPEGGSPSGVDVGGAGVPPRPVRTVSLNRGI